MRRAACLDRTPTTLQSVTCHHCGLRKAAAAAGLCIVCAGGLTVTGTDSATTAAVPHGPVITAVEHEHGEQPHTPEVEAEELAAAAETGFRELHPLQLDHPRYGMLGGPVFLACEAECPDVPGCTTCPLRADGGYQRTLPRSA